MTAVAGVRDVLRRRARRGDGPRGLGRGGGGFPRLPRDAPRLDGGDDPGADDVLPRVAAAPLSAGHGGDPRPRRAPAGSSSASAATRTPTTPSLSSGSSKAFPDDFSVRRLRGVHVGDINTEGGDLALSWLPDGSIGLLVGRHRAIRYLERRNGESLLGQSPDDGADRGGPARVLVGLLRRRGPDRRRGRAPRPVARQRGAVPRGHGRRGHAERHRSARVRSDVREASRRRELPEAPSGRRSSATSRRSTTSSRSRWRRAATASCASRSRTTRSERPST